MNTPTTGAAELPEALREALAAPAELQEPIAVVTGHFCGRCVVRPIDPSLVLKNGMALFTTPAPAVDEQAAKDVARYRLLRRKVAIAGSRFHILNLDPLSPEQYPDEGLDKAIDAALAAKGVNP